MIVIVLERTPPAVRGLLTRWMLELKAGVFVGTVSARVRDELWRAVTSSRRAGSCMLVHRAQTEQGFEIRVEGDPSRAVVDYDGLQLLRRPPPNASDDDVPF